jgi:DNA ligase D-like protein (predicted 3'-phosphoesterase)
MNGTHRIVIQKHKTPYPHHDLRLEMGGVLRSWILPKNSPIEDVKRLAIEDKDQGLGLASTGSIISDGYGIGEAEVWDSGVYEVEWMSKSKIVFRVWCEKFSGRFILLLPSWGIWSKKRLWILFRD